MLCFPIIYTYICIIHTYILYIHIHIYTYIILYKTILRQRHTILNVCSQNIIQYTTLEIFLPEKTRQLGKYLSLLIWNGEGFWFRYEAQTGLLLVGGLAGRCPWSGATFRCGLVEVVQTGASNNIKRVLTALCIMYVWFALTHVICTFNLF